MPDYYSGAYTGAQIDAGIAAANAAAPQSTTYSKTETNALLDTKADLVSGKVPASELPSYVDDSVEGYYYNGAFYEDSEHTTIITGERGKIYIDLTANKSYRWTGSVYTRIDECPAFGETAGTIYEGNKGKANADAIGALSSLTTTDKTSLVGAINELDSDKVDAVSGKGLSTEDYTTAEKTKLSGIAAGAEVNVQANWTQTDTTADDYIKNKPSVLSLGETSSTAYAGNKGKQNADNISITKSALVDLINQEAKNISGTQSLSDVNSYATVNLGGLNYPGEKYEVSFGSLLSGDSSANTCLVVGLDGTNVVTNNLQLSRGNNVHGTLTSSGIMTQIRIYASDSAAHSTGDMLSFTNLMVCKKSFYDVTSTYKTFVPDNALLYSCIGNTNSLTTTAKLSLVAAINELNSSKITASDYATQNTGGTVKVWTTTDGTDTILHIATQ